MFKHLKVIELASVLAGPSVGQFFAELGAEVIKIENSSGGDVTRSWRVVGEQSDDRSAYFCSVNWGKKSLVLNLKDKNERQTLYNMLQTADIVIASYKPGDAEKLKVDYQSLKQINPKIIYGKITGFGDKINRVGLDAIIQAESGFMSMNGEQKSGPVKMPVALMDILAAHQLKEAILLALIHRMQSGEGAEVEVNLIQSAIASLANQATNYLIANQIPDRIGSAHPNIVPYGEIYTSKDNIQFVLAVGSDHQFIKLCHILNTDLHEKIAFNKNHKRVENRAALKGELSSLFKTWIFNELQAEFLINNIPFGRVRNVKEALNTPYAEELLLASENLKSIRVNAFKLSFYKPETLLAPPHYVK